MRAEPSLLGAEHSLGVRVDHIANCYAWRTQKDIAAKEGLIAIPYERAEGEFSRLYQLSKMYKFSPVSGLYWCR